ncbi:hypothetical protein DIPPA_05380 [Diplonema papillatum]|nr:hypothetical protein DIPPA_05380 [Diplonema papillatum]
MTNKHQRPNGKPKAASAKPAPPPIAGGAGARLYGVEASARGVSRTLYRPHYKPNVATSGLYSRLVVSGHQPHVPRQEPQTTLKAAPRTAAFPSFTAIRTESPARHRAAAAPAAHHHHHHHHRRAGHHQPAPQTPSAARRTIPNLPSAQPAQSVYNHTPEASSQATPSNHPLRSTAPSPPLPPPQQAPGQGGEAAAAAAWRLSDVAREEACSRGYLWKRRACALLQYRFELQEQLFAEHARASGPAGGLRRGGSPGADNLFPALRARPASSSSCSSSGGSSGSEKSENDASDDAPFPRSRRSSPLPRTGISSTRSGSIIQERRRGEGENAKATVGPLLARHGISGSSCSRAAASAERQEKVAAGPLRSTGVHEGSSTPSLSARRGNSSRAEASKPPKNSAAEPPQTVGVHECNASFLLARRSNSSSRAEASKPQERLAADPLQTAGFHECNVSSLLARHSTSTACDPEADACGSATEGSSAPSLLARRSSNSSSRAEALKQREGLAAEPPQTAGVHECNARRSNSGSTSTACDPEADACGSATEGSAPSLLARRSSNSSSGSTGRKAGVARWGIRPHLEVDTGAGARAPLRRPSASPECIATVALRKIRRLLSGADSAPDQHSPPATATAAPVRSLSSSQGAAAYQVQHQSTTTTTGDRNRPMELNTEAGREREAEKGSDSPPSLLAAQQAPGEPQGTRNGTMSGRTGGREGETSSDFPPSLLAAPQELGDARNGTIPGCIGETEGEEGDDSPPLLLVAPQEPGGNRNGTIPGRTGEREGEEGDDSPPSLLAAPQEPGGTRNGTIPGRTGGTEGEKSSDSPPSLLAAPQAPGEPQDIRNGTMPGRTEGVKSSDSPPSLPAAAPRPQLNTRWGSRNGDVPGTAGGTEGGEGGSTPRFQRQAPEGELGDARRGPVPGRTRGRESDAGADRSAARIETTESAARRALSAEHAGQLLGLQLRFQEGLLRFSLPAVLAANPAPCRKAAAAAQLPRARTPPGAARGTAAPQPRFPTLRQSPSAQHPSMDASGASSEHHHPRRHSVPESSNTLAGHLLPGTDTSGDPAEPNLPRRPHSVPDSSKTLAAVPPPGMDTCDAPAEHHHHRQHSVPESSNTPADYLLPGTVTSGANLPRRPHSVPESSKTLATVPGMDTCDAPAEHHHHRQHSVPESSNTLADHLLPGTDTSGAPAEPNLPRRPHSVPESSKTLAAADLVPGMDTSDAPAEHHHHRRHSVPESSSRKKICDGGNDGSSSNSNGNDDSTSKTNGSDSNDRGNKSSKTAAETGGSSDIRSRNDSGTTGHKSSITGHNGVASNNSNITHNTAASYNGNTARHNSNTTGNSSSGNNTASLNDNTASSNSNAVSYNTTSFTSLSNNTASYSSTSTTSHYTTNDGATSPRRPPRAAREAVSGPLGRRASVHDAGFFHHDRSHHDRGDSGGGAPRPCGPPAASAAASRARGGACPREEAGGMDVVRLLAVSPCFNWAALDGNDDDDDSSTDSEPSPTGRYILCISTCFVGNTRGGCQLQKIKGG